MCREGTGYIGHGMLNVDLPGRRWSGRAHRKLMNVAKEDMEKVGVTEKKAKDPVRWRKTIFCG